MFSKWKTSILSGYNYWTWHPLICHEERHIYSYTYIIHNIIPLKLYNYNCSGYQWDRSNTLSFTCFSPSLSIWVFSLVVGTPRVYRSISNQDFWSHPPQWHRILFFLTHSPWFGVLGNWRQDNRAIQIKHSILTMPFAKWFWECWEYISRNIMKYIPVHACMW